MEENEHRISSFKVAQRPLFSILTTADPEEQQNGTPLFVNFSPEMNYVSGVREQFQKRMKKIADDKMKQVGWFSAI